MIDLLVRSIVASAIGLMALMLARKASASVRHLIAVAGLAAAVAVPLLGALLPRVSVPVLPAPKPEPTPAVVAAPPKAMPFPTEIQTIYCYAAPPPVYPWKEVWLTASVLLILRSFARWNWLRRKLRNAAPIQGLGPHVAVVESDAFDTPMVAWIGRTVIVLPAGWREWPAERLNVVLRHEMAHVQRGDGWSLLLARIAWAAMWPNPLVWWLALTESRLAECAADDWVVQSGIPAWAYAQELLAIVRESGPTGSLPALGMAQKAEVAQRVEMILNPKTPRTLVSRRFRIAMLGVSLVAAVPVATWALGTQSLGARPQPQFSATLATGPEQPDFLLKCKLVRRKAPWSLSYVDSRVEPQIGQSDPSRVAVIPDATTANGVPVALNVKADSVRLRVSLTPHTDLLNPPSLSVESSEPYKAAGLSFNKAEYRVRPNAWVRYALADLRNVGTSHETTEYGEYELLVQMVPLEHGPAPQRATSPEAALPTGPALASPATQADLAAASKKALGKVLLNCKLVRTADPGAKPFATSVAEPTVGGSSPQHVLTPPPLRTEANQPATFVAQIGTTRSMVVLTPSVLKNGLYRLAVEVGVIANLKNRKKASTVVTLGANEWVLMRLLDESGNYLGYQMLAQLVPVNGA
jgi:hypothetical protein